MFGADGQWERRAGKDLDKEAIKAVKRWKFMLAMLDGKPIALHIAKEVSFDLH